MIAPHPSGWESIPLGRLLGFSNGVNAEKSAYGSGIPFANVLEVITRESLRAKDVPGRIALHPEVATRYLVRRGDVLFNRTSETTSEVGLASVYLDDEPIVFGGFVIKGRPISGRLDPAYAAFALRAESVRTQIVGRGQGGIRANIGQHDLRAVKVLLPPVIEQQRIAIALLDAGRVVSQIERAIVKNRAIKQALMQTLLTGRSRLPGFTGSWSGTALGDLLVVRHGRDQKTVATAGGKYPILATGGEIGRTNTPLYSKPSVLIGRKGTIDRPQFQTGPFWTVDTLFYTEISPEADPRFLFYLFCMVDWRSMNEASGVPSLSSRRIEGIEVLVPALDEQKAIAGLLADADVELDALRSRLTKAKAIKQGMMQELLTGRTRLPVPDESEVEAA